MSVASQGYFEPAIMRSQSTQPQIPTSPPQITAAYAMQASQQRKRSATAPSPASSPLSASIISAATGLAANVAAFSSPRDKEPPSSPKQQLHAIPHPPPPQPQRQPEALTPPHPSQYIVSTPLSTGKEKKESSKKKLFSKPTRIGTPTMEKAHRPLPSPNKLNAISSPMPRMTPSASALAAAIAGDRRPSFTSMHTGSSITLVSASGEGFHHQYSSSYSSSPPAQKDSHAHSHKPHFLRPRRDKDHHSGITFSSSSSNSKAISADGSSLYSFGPSSPSTAVFGVSSKADLQKSISGIDISASKKNKGQGHGGNSWEDGFFDGNLASGIVTETAWPHLRQRILGLFEGEPLRNTVEDLNKLVTLHIKRCYDRRSPGQLIDDVRDLLDTGMLTLDPTLPTHTDEKSISRLVEIWSLLFGKVLPYFEAVFLPLQQEFKGVGTIMSAKESREFFGVLVDTDGLADRLDVRRLVLMSFRDNVVLPLHEKLRMLFSKLTLDFSISQTEITHNAGRMLQCVSVLSSVLTADDAQNKIDELAKTLKHNWLSRGRTGRNRRGFVGTKTMRAVV
ncbi:hypothetical protein Q9L58_000020 [Maublancomyces gigas]|uniref:HbrB-like protein n=1 Tax=Discina gigas TaxID=1032678 RepID=A0ABR3GXN1_9PEZI